MSLSKIRRKRQKGFTLIELMIVIAVIAILAAVLIPRSTLVQNSAKEAGVESNARQVQGLLEGIMHRASHATDLRTKLETRVDKADIKNPFTGVVDAEVPATTVDPTGDYAVSISPDAADTTGGEKWVGLVWVHIQGAGTDRVDKVIITPYGADGKPIDGAEIILVE